MSEKGRILQMVRDGKISVDEGLELIGALDEADAKAAQSAQTPPSTIRDRFLRVRVDSADAKVNVNIPLGLLKVASNLVTMGSGFIPQEARREMEAKGIDLSKINFEELVRLIDEGLVDGKLVDVDVDDPKEGRTRVEVYDTLAPGRIGALKRAGLGGLGDPGGGPVGHRRRPLSLERALALVLALFRELRKYGRLRLVDVQAGKVRVFIDFY